MTLVEQVKELVNGIYTDADGETFTIDPESGLSDAEIDNLIQQLPGKRLSPEIRELLQFTRGFDVYFIEGVTFNGLGLFGLESLFPCSVEAGRDGTGNSWIIDIDTNGNWGPVFYACHDPAVIVKVSDNLQQYIQHLHELAQNTEECHLYTIYSKMVYDIYKNKAGYMDVAEARRSGDIILSGFATSLPDNFAVVDMRYKKNGEGFTWHPFHAHIDTAIRHNDELLWGIQKQEKKGFFARLFK